jgi:branched-chain amino acid transport system substrate-binding protein
VRNRTLTTIAVVVTSGAIVLSGCASKSKSSNSNPPPVTTTGASSTGAGSSGATPQAGKLNPVLPAGNGQAKCTGVELAYIGTINGAAAALGQSIDNGAKLAVTQHNKANSGCQVGYKEFDSEGSPDKAPGVVTQAISEKAIIGVVGLPFSGESKATGAAFDDAGLVHITPSATDPALSTNGWKTFFRGVGNDASQGPAAAKFLTDDLGAKKVCVVADDSAYGKGLAATVKSALGGDVACTDDVKTNQKDFSATVNKVTAAQPDAVYYAGYYPEAGPFDQQLKQAGFNGKFVGPDGVRDPEFIKLAGQSAAEGVYFTCPCVPAEAAATFKAEYHTAYGSDPQTYAAESYDAATVLLAGIDKGNATRADLLNWVKNYDADGISKHLKWNSTGELDGTVAVWSYVVKGGVIVPFKELT